MASHSRNVSRYKKELNPVTDITLILVSLHVSSSAKTGVANQIQHHLKGNITVDDTNPLSDDDDEPTPPESHQSCEIQEGKVLGLKVTTVITPDVDEANVEQGDYIKTFRNHVSEFAIGYYVVVMVTAAESKEDRRAEVDTMVQFSNVVFGNETYRYSLAVLTSDTVEIVQSTPKRRNRLAKGGKTKETNLLQDGGMTMTFDLKASKEPNDKQVQVLFNHGKTLVKRKREEQPSPDESSIMNGTGDAPSTVTSSPVTTSTDTTSPCQDTPQQQEDGFELTIDSLKPEDINELDECWEVLEELTSSLMEQREDRYQSVMEDQQQGHDNPCNISFMTSNPIGYGDLQC